MFEIKEIVDSTMKIGTNCRLFGYMSKPMTPSLMGSLVY
jgi:hypothetical protein